MSAPTFPPLFRGEAAPPGVDPMVKAISAATLGCEPGLIIYAERLDALSAALVLAPECPLEEAMAMVFAASLGFADALGALAPPEVGVHMVWPAGFRVNGATCGALRVAASTQGKVAEPDWLILSLDVPFVLEGEPGANPDRTALYEEGCADLLPQRLLESWSRHTLVWINHWMDEGMRRLHADWRARAFALGEEVAFDLGGAHHAGLFVGIDERGGMLLRSGEETRLIPLSTLLEG